MKQQLVIYVAVLHQEYTPIEVTNDNSHVITFDDIEIKEEDFKQLFFSYGETFGINKLIANKKELFPFISFIVPYRTVDDKRFFLLETILNNIENDLNISRNCFTTESIIELTNEIIKINSLCDINCSSVLASLPWSNIKKIIDNDTLSIDYKKKDKVICFVISIIFKTPTPGVKPNIFRFPYIIKKK
jgi:hypothetical protein